MSVEQRQNTRTKEECTGARDVAMVLGKPCVKYWWTAHQYACFHSVSTIPSCSLSKRTGTCKGPTSHKLVPFTLYTLLWVFCERVEW
jgi:hypothetical protein